MSFSWPVRFLIRAAGTALVIGAAAMWLGHYVFEWRQYTMPVALWCAAMSVLIGFVSYRAKRQGALGGASSATAIAASLLGGMLICVVLLVGSLFAVNYLFGEEWVTRALSVLIMQYIAMVALSVITLHQELNERKAQRGRNGDSGSRMHSRSLEPSNGKGGS
ncbi:MAG: hypothetical protein L0Z55_08580 [Planctomycetes bacterium]|nr:hypothetical protein [Planctomycetota bacterium]